MLVAHEIALYLLIGLSTLTLLFYCFTRCFRSPAAPTAIQEGFEEMQVKRLGTLGSIIPLHARNFPDLFPSNTTILRYNNQYITNIRYINYKIEPQKGYVFYKNGSPLMKNGNPQPNLDVTQNMIVHLNEKFETIPPYLPLQIHDSHIPKQDTPTTTGIQDIRLYSDDGKLKMIGTTIEHSYKEGANGNAMILGDYDPAMNTLHNLAVLKSPQGSETQREKNWTPIGGNRFIYKWHPLQIGEIQQDEPSPQLQIVKEIDTPAEWKAFRGSAPVVTYRESYWVLIHEVYKKSATSGEVSYVHRLITFSPEWTPLQVSDPFYFDIFNIEYCLSMLIESDTFIFSVSKMDATPFIVKVPYEQIKTLFRESSAANRLTSF